MLWAFVFINFLFFPVVTVFASSHVADFVFTTESRTVKPGEISEEIIIQAQDSGGNAVSPNETLDLEFLSSSVSGEFLNSSAESVSTVWNSNWKNRTFYYRDSAMGVYTLRVKAVGRASLRVWEMAQSITISEGGAVSSSSSSTQTNLVLFSSPSPSSGPSQPAPERPNIKAYAGEDRTVVAGALLEFSGSATGLKGEPLINARFFWNFGDGETKEGRAVSHIFMIPGKYVIGLHVSSGEYAASDYLNVDASPNQITISSVLLGESGYAKLVNLTKFEVDIGGWVLEDSSGKSFNVPSRTKIGSKTEIAFANAVTGLLETSSSLDLILRYPNLSLAAEWKSVPKVSEQKIVETESSSKISTASKKEIAMSEKIPTKPPVYKETIMEAEDKVVKPEARKEFAALSASSRVNLFFVVSVVLGLAATVGFLFLKKTII